MDQVIGTCSICGGRVTVPAFWWGVVPPTPTCETCGGVKADHGTVIEMKPAPRQRWSTGTSAELYWTGQHGTDGKRGW